MRLPILILLFIALAGCGVRPAVTPQENGQGSLVEKHALPMPAGEWVEHPLARPWTGFPVGTTVTQTTTTENEDNPAKTVTTIVFHLKEKTDQHVIVESQATTVHYTGRVETNPPREMKAPLQMPLPSGMTLEAWKKQTPQGQGTPEKITILRKEYDAYRHQSKDRTEAGELSITAWTSPQIPGELLKSVSKVPAKRATITLEVTAVTIPMT